MADDPHDRITALEAKVQELETLVNLALRLLAMERPVSALLVRFGASDEQERAVHALLDDVLKRVEAGGFYAPSFAGLASDLGERFPAAKNDREFVTLLLDTLQADRPAYQKLHAYAMAQGWPDWR